MRISAFKISLKLKTLKACNFFPLFWLWVNETCTCPFCHHDISLLGFLTTNLLKLSEKAWSAARDMYFFWAGRLWHVVLRWLPYHSAKFFLNTPISWTNRIFLIGKVTLPNIWIHRTSKYKTRLRIQISVVCKMMPGSYFAEQEA